ncbi:hypothetical protein KKG31_07175 [Patescibacteria group bacterium]|nr:hypothetical protein [Patescibacteria group bacterium]
MERERLNYTATLARRIAELLQQEIPAKDSISDTKKNILKVKNMISQSGPMIVYNGTLSENERIRDILQREDIIIPQEKVLVLDNEYTHNTNDQIKTMIIPEELHKAGKEIGLISSAPHLWRVIHVLNQYKTLPEDMKVRLFPVATPYDGKEEYAVMEIMGLLYYAYITKSAKLEAYPHIIH